MDRDNPYAPPRTHVTDVVEPGAPLMRADRGIRFAAAFLDSIICAGMIYAPLLVSAVIRGGLIGATQSDVDPTQIIGAGLIAALIGFSVWLGVTVRFVLRNSQSIAKRLLGIKVVRADGSPCSFSRIFWLRNVVNLFFSLLPLYSIIDALFIFGESQQCLHDRLADTIVVKA